MRKLTVLIEGTQPLLQHRFTENDAAGARKATRAQLVREIVPRDEAAPSLYQRANGTFAHPSASIQRMLAAAGSNHKLKGSRKSARFVVPACVRLVDDYTTILDPDTNKAATQWEVDSRSVVIPATKGRIMRHRPRWDRWGMRIEIQLNESILPAEFIHTLFKEAGDSVGLGDYRPEKGGPFGTFRVTEFKEG